MSLEFDPATHTYRLDGRVVPSVTQILDLLEDWSGVAPEVLEAARDFGSNVHAACHLYNQDALDWSSLDPSLVPYVEGWARFLDDSGAVVILSEHQVVHRELGYAGTLDVMAEWSSARQALIDIKSGQLPRTVGPQTAAYSQAYDAMSGTKPSRRHRYCVQLNPTFPRGYKLHALTNPADWSIFQSALNCWRFRNEA